MSYPKIPGNCEYLPQWKRNATAEERFLELAATAAKHPEWFDRLLVVYQEEQETETKTRYAVLNASTVQLLGLLRMCEWEVQKVVS